jgi:hypothetical protein
MVSDRLWALALGLGFGGNGFAALDHAGLVTDLVIWRGDDL